MGTDNLLTSAGTVVFGSTVDSALGTTDSLTVTAMGLTTFNGAVGAANALNNLTITNAAKLNGGSIATSGNQLYSSSVVLGVDNSLIAAGAIGFTSTVDSATTTAKSLSVNAGGLTSFNNTIGATHALNNLTVASTANLNGNTIATTGNQLYSGAITLGTDNTLTATAGTITFGNTIDSLTSTAKNLTLTASGVTQLNGAVGSTNSVNNLTITNAAVLNGFGINTVANQQYSGATSLGTDTTLTATAGSIAFGGTLDSTNVNSPRSLTINDTGTTTFTGAVNNVKRNLYHWFRQCCL